ncbi:MAG: hypothetical protein IT374_14735 [Polyangiaceae bacterium]|nr:hypothetical protein [Polyangiaceae bacterium]
MRAALLLALCSLVGCSRESSAPPSAAATATPSHAPAPASTRPAVAPGQLITPGKGVTSAQLGAGLSIVERELGPCTKMHQDGKRRVCFYPHRGLEIALVDNDVTRVSAHRGGRTVPDKELADLTFTQFPGATAEGVRPGMTKVDAEAKLGPPRASDKPKGDVPAKDGARRIAVLEYPGLALEVEMVHGELIVGAIHVPKGP